VPSANLDLARSIFDAWERGDFSSAEWACHEIEFVHADGPSPGCWSGLAGMAEATRMWIGAWDEFSVEAEDYRELDHERVLVLTRYGGRGKRSGLDVENMRAMGASVVHLREGQVTRFVQYWVRDRALADLGLTPKME
jgi:ketosteroid isomerase-like protein